MTDDISLYGRLSPIKPEALAGWRVGDLADAPTLGRVRVTALHPPSLIEVQTESGGPLPMRLANPSADTNGARLMDAKKEAAKLQRQIGGLGIATLVRDGDNKLHVLAGHDFDVIGVYGEGLKQADLIEDITHVEEKA